MKYFICLILAAIPFCAFGADFMYCEYDNYDHDYWYDEYWDDGYYCDGYWVYYPHGYYCVRYVWWYPWWWNHYWWRCHWCHHFSWDFYYGGFYMVWYESGCWWFRPRYGRWVRYRMPYTYKEIRYHSQLRGIKLPPKPPREINIPYKEAEIMKLSKERDPELFKQVEKEHKSGNLEKMREDYQKNVDKEIIRKNLEYKANKDLNKGSYINKPSKTPTKAPSATPVPYKTPGKKSVKTPYYNDDYNNNNLKKSGSKSPGASRPQYDPPANKEPAEDKDVKKNSKSKTTHEKAPSYNKPDVKSDNVMKNPYSKPDGKNANAHKENNQKSLPGKKR